MRGYINEITYTSDIVTMRQTAYSLFRFFLSPTVATTPGKREQLATRTVFFLSGFATATWAALVPFAKANTGINEGTLGLLLLCLGCGALISMPLTGTLTSRFGCRRVLSVSAILYSAMLPLLAVLTHVGLLALALLLFGMGVGIAGCASNVQAILVEKAAKRPMMSGFHGFYSVGGIVGALAMSTMMSAGLTELAATAITVFLILGLLLANMAGLLPYAHPPEGPTIAIPKGAVLVLGIICFIVFMAEGTVLDWSAVFLIKHRDMPAAQGGLGFACFASAMTLGRLTGDKIIARLKPHPLVITGALVAALGLVVAITVPYWQAALLGYALIGIGCSNIVPIMFSATGRQTSMPQAVAVPAVTTLGYLGVLAGPAGIGFIAHHSGLGAGFLVVAVLMVVAALLSRNVKI